MINEWFFWSVVVVTIALLFRAYFPPPENR